MADVADIAEELIEIRLQESLSKIQRPRNSVSSEFCFECGADIPEARRAALPGVQLCMACQQIHELTDKQYRR